jgi:1,4-dihydroxy-2-naphthoate octaprenyltransferase
LPFLLPAYLFFAGSFAATVWLTLLALFLAIHPLQLVWTTTDGPSLIRALAGTARVQLAFGILLSAGILL